MHTHTSTQAHTHEYTCACTNMHVSLHRDTRVCIYEHVCMHKHTVCAHRNAQALHRHADIYASNMHTCVHTDTHAHMCVCVHAPTRECARVYTHMGAVQAHKCVHRLAYVCTLIHRNTCRHVCACIHACMCTHRETQICYAHRHTHTGKTGDNREPCHLP
jgi:hypothetical protein